MKILHQTHTNMNNNPSLNRTGNFRTCFLYRHDFSLAIRLHIGFFFPTIFYLSLNSCSPRNWDRRPTEPKQPNNVYTVHSALYVALRVECRRTLCTPTIVVSHTFTVHTWPSHVAFGSAARSKWIYVKRE